MTVTRVDSAPMASGDPTRRYGVASPDGVLMPGLTRDEAGRASEWLADLAPVDRPLAMWEVALPVVLTDGAGPHLLDADGHLMLVVAAHPVLDGALMAMGQVGSRHAVGVARRVVDGGWAWLVRALVDGPDRIAALDELDAVADWPTARIWAATWAGAISTLAP